MKEKEEELESVRWQTTLARILKTHSEFKGKVGFVLLMIVISRSFAITVPLIVAKIITQLSEGASLEVIFPKIWLFLGLSIAALFCDRMRDLYEIKYLDLDVSDDLAGQTIGHLQKLSVGQHKDQHSLVTISKVGHGEAAIKQLFYMMCYHTLPILIGVIVSLTSLLVFFPEIGVINLAFGICIIYAGIKIGKAFAKPVDKYRENFSNKTVSKTGGELIRHMASMMIAVVDDRFKNKHLRQRKYRRDVFLKVYIPMYTKFMFLQGISVIGQATTFGLAVYMVSIGAYELGAIAAITAWSGQSLGMLQNTVQIYRNVVTQWADIVQYFRIMDTVPAIDAPEHPVDLSGIEGEVVFSNVSLTYPGADKMSLNDVSLTIKPGQKVGIVGPTGAGKSTLLRMLQLAYKPDLGSIRVDGIDLLNVDRKKYLSEIGFIEQEPVMPSLSLRQSILYELSEERRQKTTDEQIKKVLKRLKMDDLISRLNKNAGEGSNKLSGGQRQRIAIARMLLKQPQMLVVDEGTSAVDPATERIIHEELDRLSPGATRIFVAHRISTVQDADLIVVMDEGRITAQGTHVELMENCDLYRDLVNNMLIRY